MLTVHDIQAAAEVAAHLREQAADAESRLQQILAAYCDEQRGRVRDLAKLLGITEQYVSDVKIGRRQISDALVKRFVSIKHKC